jgi:hypothetical protein
MHVVCFCVAPSWGLAPRRSLGHLGEDRRFAKLYLAWPPHCNLVGHLVVFVLCGALRSLRAVLSAATWAIGHHVARGNEVWQVACHKQ